MVSIILLHPDWRKLAFWLSFFHFFDHHHPVMRNVKLSSSMQIVTSNPDWNLNSWRTILFVNVQGLIASYPAEHLCHIKVCGLLCWQLWLCPVPISYRPLSLLRMRYSRDTQRLSRASAVCLERCTETIIKAGSWRKENNIWKNRTKRNKNTCMPYAHHGPNLFGRFHALCFGYVAWVAVWPNLYSSIVSILMPWWIHCQFLRHQKRHNKDTVTVQVPRKMTERMM